MARLIPAWRSWYSCARVAMLVTIAYSASFTALANCPKSGSDYSLYFSDINGDGVLDYALIPRPITMPIMMDGEVFSIIALKSKLTAFTYSSAQGGTRVLQALSSQQLPAGNWQSAPQQLTVVDPAGSGCGSLVVRGIASPNATDSTDTAVVRFTAAGQPMSAQVIKSANSAYGLGAGDLRATDINGDGRQDLVHYVGGLIQGVYLADSQAVLQFQDNATIEAVWADFLAAARSQDSRAKRYLTSNVLEAHGDELTPVVLQTVLGGIKASGIAFSNAKFASITAQVASSRGDILHSVLFGKTNTGTWRITVI
jgi:hypothetical protein